jgi:hypothetical protein
MKEKVRSAGVTAGLIAKSWQTFNGGIFVSPGLAIDANGKEVVVTSGPTTCKVDRRTLLPRRYISRDEQGAARFTLELTDYRDVDGIFFPHRYTATSDTGTIVIALTDVELNGELAPAAFTPPKRAEKLP